MRYQRRARSGFTLIEMMVATTLVLVIMLIISQAFGAASKTFSSMRTAGYMQERLRTGTNALKKDLGNDHFGPPYGSARNGPHVSDQRLDQIGWVPPPAGYFNLTQPMTATPSIMEPANFYLSTGMGETDGEKLTSTRATGHVLQFTVRLPDGPAPELFSAQLPAVPPGTSLDGSPMFGLDPRVNAFVNATTVNGQLQSLFYSRWAEVIYYLDPTQDPTIVNTQANGGGLPLYTLRRRVRLLAPKSVDYYVATNTALQIIAQFQQLYIDSICPFIAGPAPAKYGQNAVTLRMPGPEALNLPDLDYTLVYAGQSPVPQYVERMAQDLANRGLPLRHPTGDDLVIGDVLSFDVKAAWFNNSTFNTPPALNGVGNNGTSPPSNVMANVSQNNPYYGGNMDEPFDDLPMSKLMPGGQNNPTAPGNGYRMFDTGTLRLKIPLSPPIPPTVYDPPDWDQPGTFTAPLSTGFLTSGVSTVPLRINVRALQIKLRVWDPRAEAARQATIIVEI
jgi:prepilin-type N-terminal cleavage/methylation domain-containing protein